MFGLLLVFQTEINSIKKEMCTFLKDHPTSTAIEKISFPTIHGEIKISDFVWEERDKEFSWKGEWYDVLYIQQTKDTLQAYVVKDGKETNLLKAYANTHDIHGKNKKVSATKFSFFIQPDIINAPKLVFCWFPTTIENIVSKTSGSREAIYQPPKMV